MFDEGAAIARQRVATTQFTFDETPDPHNHNKIGPAASTSPRDAHDNPTKATANPPSSPRIQGPPASSSATTNPLTIAKKADHAMAHRFNKLFGTELIGQGGKKVRRAHASLKEPPPDI